MKNKISRLFLIFVLLFSVSACNAGILSGLQGAWKSLSNSSVSNSISSFYSSNKKAIKIGGVAVVGLVGLAALVIGASYFCNSEWAKNMRGGAGEIEAGKKKLEKEKKVVEKDKVVEKESVDKKRVDDLCDAFNNIDLKSTGDQLGYGLPRIKCNFKRAQKLFNSMPDINAEYCFGRSPMALACLYGCNYLVQWLVTEKKAKVEAKDLDLAFKNKHIDILKFFIDKSDDNNNYLKKIVELMQINGVVCESSADLNGNLEFVKFVSGKIAEKDDISFLKLFVNKIDFKAFYSENKFISRNLEFFDKKFFDQLLKVLNKMNLQEDKAKEIIRVLLKSADILKLRPEDLVNSIGNTQERLEFLMNEACSDIDTKMIKCLNDNNKIKINFYEIVRRLKEDAVKKYNYAEKEKLCEYLIYSLDKNNNERTAEKYKIILFILEEFNNAGRKECYDLYKAFVEKICSFLEDFSKEMLPSDRLKMMHLACHYLDLDTIIRFLKKWEIMVDGCVVSCRGYKGPRKDRIRMQTELAEYLLANFVKLTNHLNKVEFIKKVLEIILEINSFSLFKSLIDEISDDKKLLISVIADVFCWYNVNLQMIKYPFEMGLLDSDDAVKILEGICVEQKKHRLLKGLVEDGIVKETEKGFPFVVNKLDEKGIKEFKSFCDNCRFYCGLGSNGSEPDCMDRQDYLFQRSYRESDRNDFINDILNIGNKRMELVKFFVDIGVEGVFGYIGRPEFFDEKYDLGGSNKIFGIYLSRASKNRKDLEHEVEILIDSFEKISVGNSVENVVGNGVDVPQGLEKIKFLFSQEETPMFVKQDCLDALLNLHTAMPNLITFEDMKFFYSKIEFNYKFTNNYTFRDAKKFAIDNKMLDMYSNTIWLSETFICSKDKDLAKAFEVTPYLQRAGSLLKDFVNKEERLHSKQWIRKKEEKREQWYVNDLKNYSVVMECLKKKDSKGRNRDIANRSVLMGWLKNIPVICNNEVLAPDVVTQIVSFAETDFNGSKLWLKSEETIEKEREKAKKDKLEKEIEKEES